MQGNSSLAGLDEKAIALFRDVLPSAGAPPVQTIERLNITDLGLRGPSVLVCNLDMLKTDPLEFLRQVRFVLPQCVIVVYTEKIKRAWALGCHLAGANCLLPKDATPTELTIGIHEALASGCYTDPRFGTAGAQLA